MLPRSIQITTGLFGLIVVVVFVVGLSYSISTGFAGFWGGLPFVIIIACVLPMAAYDYWDECVRKTINNGDSGE
ncbi:MAG: hypothetical protein F4239_06560 [Gammaproteobacteria bacterium]|nr:hypothetical protein [Gammaproteobacteria bacterium]MYD78544.1 hypothetical protein [Gammaproteobacteria bacterium]MYI89487.1 hypothetical protein [Gammaproteobacteria bacterium]